MIYAGTLVLFGQTSNVEEAFCRKKSSFIHEISISSELWRSIKRSLLKRQDNSE